MINNVLKMHSKCDVKLPLLTTYGINTVTKISWGFLFRLIVNLERCDGHTKMKLGVTQHPCFRLDSCGVNNKLSTKGLSVSKPIQMKFFK